MTSIISKEEEAIDLEEEKQEEEDVVKDLQPQPNVGAVSRQISTISTQFDSDGKGYLTQTEQNARNLAKKDGSIDPEAAIKLTKAHGKLILYLKIIATVVFALVIAIVVMGTSLSKGINKTGQNTQASIAESVQTKVEVDPMGASHLLDKQSGNELTVRSNGDSFVTEAKFDALSGRKLNCLPMGDVAQMVSDISKGTQGSVIINDEDNVESEIVSIAGNFKDNYSFLQFASFRVDLDSDSCDTAVGTPFDTTVAVKIEQPDPISFEQPEVIKIEQPDPIADVEPALEDPAIVEENNKAKEEEDPKEEESDTFNRNLRHMPPQAAAAVAVPVGRSQALARHRDEYIEARTALHEGRKLAAYSEVEILTDSEGTVTGGELFNVLDSDDYEFVFVGKGNCLDGMSNQYDRLKWNCESADSSYCAKACAESCSSENFDNVLGMSLYQRNFSGGKHRCSCLFENGNAPQPPDDDWTKSDSLPGTTGSGIIVKAGGLDAKSYACWKSKPTPTEPTFIIENPIIIDQLSSNEDGIVYFFACPSLSLSKFSTNPQCVCNGIKSHRIEYQDENHSDPLYACTSSDYEDCTSHLDCDVNLSTCAPVNFDGRSECIPKSGSTEGNDCKSYLNCADGLDCDTFQKSTGRCITPIPLPPKQVYCPNLNAGLAEIRQCVCSYPNRSHKITFQNSAYPGINLYACTQPDYGTCFEYDDCDINNSACRCIDSDASGQCYSKQCIPNAGAIDGSQCFTCEVCESDTCAYVDGDLRKGICGGSGAQFSRCYYS